MECEICGKAASKKATIEEAVLNVCSACAKLGSEVKQEAPRPVKRIYPIEELSVDPSFAVIVKAKRETLALSRGQLAALVKEKESVIERIEHGMRPTKDAAKKLEHALRIKILGYEAIAAKLPKAKDIGITLGDIAEVRVRKKPTKFI